jgi:hypothetical protein
MTQWEYCIVDLSFNHTFVFYLTPEGVQEEEVLTDPSLGDQNAWFAAQRRIAALGQEGWEMYAVNDTERFFKRERSR